MEATLQRIIRKLELNENAVSTILGGLVLLIVTILFINYFSHTKLNQKVAETPATDTEQISSQIDTGETSSAATSRYTVATNDTLWSIAEREYGNGHMWTEIARVNNLPNPGIIEVGKELDLPRITDIEQTNTPESEAQVTTQPSSELTITEYTVQRGDYLWKIAQTVYRDGYRWTDIWQANRDKISNPNILESGLTLQIPS